VSLSQMASGLKDEIRELKQTIQNQACTISTKTLENRALQEQLDVQRRYTLTGLLTHSRTALKTEPKVFK